jgi:hypothetical protein
VLLTSLLVLQLCFDVAVAALLIGVLARRRAPAVPPAPPDWYHESIRLVQELVVAADPMLEALEGRRADAIVNSAAAAAPRDRHRRALALLRAGAYSEDTARRDGILPAELRVLRSLAVAAPHTPPSR